jgi:glycosyltransferase involved in cell wall biosynthesis
MTCVRPLHILMTADAVGGVWQYATDLAAEFGLAGHRVTVALVGPRPTAAQREQAQAIAGLRLIETDLPLDWLSHGPQPVRAAAEAMARLAADCSVDVVHCNMPSLVDAAEFAMPVVAVTHGCLATWWRAGRREPLPQGYRWHYELTRRGLLAADAVVSPSASYALLVEQTYDLPTRPCAVHNGRRPLHGTGGGATRLNSALTVGRLWDEVKNARLLDQAARLLPAPFLAAGPLRGPHGEEFSPQHLRALGRLENQELATLLALKPVFVSAATFEPFGLAVLEAAAAGCPLVLSDIESFRELWDGAALFVDPSDPEAFAREIASLLGDPAKAATLAQAATRRAARYTPAATARIMERIYASLLQPVEAAA